MKAPYRGSQATEEAVHDSVRIQAEHHTGEESPSVGDPHLTPGRLPCLDKAMVARAPAQLRGEHASASWAGTRKSRGC